MITIFKYIQRKPNCTRRQIQNRTKLSWGTVSMMMSELLEKGLVIEDYPKVTPLGRTPKTIIINNERNLCLGIDINITGLSFVVSDLAGRVIISHFFQVESLTHANILTTLFEKSDEFVSTYSPLSLIAISMQGKVDLKKGISHEVPYIQDWKDVPLKFLFEERYGRPTFLFHDPDCLMTYELYRNENIIHYIHNSVALRIDESIGISLLLGGKIFYGSNGFNVEIGHTIIAPDGRECRCGHLGCFEAYCSFSGLKCQYLLKTDRVITSDQFMALVEEADDPIANELFSDFIKFLSIALSNVIYLYAPEVIFINGKMMSYKHLFAPQIISALSSLTQQSKTQLILNNYNLEAPALGAILNSIDADMERILFVDEMSKLREDPAHKN
jgi:predicted NBD/HSP70 family sugar kinase